MTNLQELMNLNVNVGMPEIAKIVLAVVELILSGLVMFSYPILRKRKTAKPTD